jgi:hypothetical protein
MIVGTDLREWTYSPVKEVLFNVVIYGGLFLAGPLLLVKGWASLRQPSVLLLLMVVFLALGLRAAFRPAAALVVILLMYLHWRFDLTELGFRSAGWKGDGLAIVLLGLIYLAPTLFRDQHALSPGGSGVSAMLDRLFFNPASTTEYLFYLGFLAERLLPKTGRWGTPLLVAAMYIAHELSDPEYWYEGMRFALVYGGVALITGIYLWRRNLVVIWLGDGLGRLLG